MTTKTFEETLREAQKLGFEFCRGLADRRHVHPRRAAGDIAHIRVG